MSFSLVVLILGTIGLALWVTTCTMQFEAGRKDFKREMRRQEERQEEALRRAQREYQRRMMELQERR